LHRRSECTIQTRSSEYTHSCPAPGTTAAAVTVARLALSLLACKPRSEVGGKPLFTSDVWRERSNVEICKSRTTLATARHKTQDARRYKRNDKGRTRIALLVSNAGEDSQHTFRGVAKVN